MAILTHKEQKQHAHLFFFYTANLVKDEGHLRLDNFGDFFENNQIEWSLIQKIATELNVPNNVQS